MSKPSVREYAVLYVGKGKKESSTAAGGNVILNAGPHTLDGPEHTEASDLTRLDATASAHGLLPKLSGDPADVLLGDGTFGEPPGGTSGFDVTPPLSNAMAPWVGPSGTGVITPDPQGRVNVMTGTGYKSFPGLTFLEGRLHLVYRYGTAHNSSGSEIDYKWSDDLGQTWLPAGTATTLALATGSNDVRDPAIVALASGRLLVCYDARNPYTSTDISVKVIYSDNRGQSWSSAYSVPAVLSGTEAASTSQPVEMPDGSILIPGTIENGGNLFAVLWKSIDGGLTFPTQITVASSGSREYAELQIRLLASGNLVGLMRSDTNQHTWRTVSTDGGLTWSTPADVLTASSRPDFVEFYPGALLLFCRNNNSNFYARWAVSWDEGATWTALQNVDGSTDLSMYAAPIVLTPGYVAVVYSLENSGSDADLYLRYYYDGYGMDVLGNLVALSGGGASFASPSIVLGTAAATGAASTTIRSDSTIVAFDATVPANVAAVGIASSTGSVAKAARRDHGHALTYHDEPLTDGASNFIFDGGDIVVVTGVPN